MNSADNELPEDAVILDLKGELWPRAWADGSNKLRFEPIYGTQPWMIPITTNPTILSMQGLPMNSADNSPSDDAALGASHLTTSETTTRLDSPYPQSSMRVADSELLDAKTQDALTAPGFAAAFDPDEAEALGAFAETALTEQEAIDSAADLPAHP